MANRPDPSRRWLPADSALWQTCKLVSEINERRVPELRTPTMFPLQANEIAFATGPASVESFYAPGDGLYNTSSTVFAGTGKFGLAMGAASLAGSAIGNASRRARAISDATPMWRPIFQGSVVVSNMGFYLLDAAHKLDWDWESIDLMQVVGFTAVELQGQSTQGPIRWRITSDWAELIFVLWAMARHPQHPQLLDQSWVPRGWAQWAAAQGYPLPGQQPPSLGSL